MARFDATIKTAQRLIAKNGQAVKWRVIDDPNSDSSTPWKPDEASPQDNDVKICFLPVTTAMLETFGFVAGTEIPQGSEMGLMGALPFEPNLKDVVIRNGKELRIEKFGYLAPNGQTILYAVLFKL